MRSRTLLLFLSSIALAIAFVLPAGAATTGKAAIAAAPAKPSIVTVVPPTSAPTIVAAKADKKAEATKPAEKKPAKAKKAKKAKVKQKAVMEGAKKV